MFHSEDVKIAKLGEKILRLKAKKVKEVITYIDDNNQKMEMFDILEDGKEFKSMQVVSKRKM